MNEAGLGGRALSRGHRDGMNRQQAIVPVLALLAMAGWAVACADGAVEPSPPPPEPPRATTVAVTPATAELTALGATVRFSAEVRDQNGQIMAGAAVTWSNADGSVATVDTSGLATAVGNGTATITAAAGSARGTAQLTVAAPPHAPPFSGTASLDPDIIIPSDPTDFVDLEPAGRGDRFVYDRRHGWITIEAYLFDATFANGLFAEFQVNPEFGTWTEAEAVARAYAPPVGQIPVALREDMDAVWIHRGDEPFGGGLLVHTDRGDQYRQRGILSEILVHEGVHTSLDSAHAGAPGWLAAQAADPTFISTYARDHPDREDLAESFSAWLAVRHRRDRITEGMADTIRSAIPHRLAYFDSLDLNLCPVVGGGACEARARWTLSGTVSHGWADPLASGLDTEMAGDISRAVVEVVDGADAGRRVVADDRGRYELEALEEGQLTVRATAEGFASVDRALDLASDTALAFAISRELPTPGPPASFPDTDPDSIRALAPYYPSMHHVANIRVFSDIDSAFSREHAEHARLVWDFFDDLYAGNRGDYLDVYYTTDPDVFLKLSPHCGAALSSGSRTVATCYLDYPRWFVIPYQVPDFGTQLHEFGHDFLYAVWPAWDDYKWFIEGTAMYFEGGVFNGSLRVPEPIGYCTNLFDRFHRQDRLMPLGELIQLGGDAFLADDRTYAQSCMLFHYLERYHPGVLYSLIERINSKQIATNEQLVTALLALTGKSVSELEEAYESNRTRMSTHVHGAPHVPEEARLRQWNRDRYAVPGGAGGL